VPDESVFDDEPVEGIQYVGEDGTPETDEDIVASHAESLPPVVTASDLLPPEDDPLSSLPVEEPDADTPPDDAVPPFIIVRNKYGPGAHGMYVRDGRSIGNWLNEEHYDLDGVGVAELLAEMGLETDLALWFGNQREQRIVAETQLVANPNVQQAIAQDVVRTEQKRVVTEAFLKAQREKAKRA